MLELKINYASDEIKRLEYAHCGDSGLDLRAYIEKDIIVEAGEVKLIPTGIKIGLPVGYEGLVRAKSGLSSKQEVSAILGTLDNCYRGEIKVILHNHGKNKYVVRNGEKIAQLVIAPVATVNVFTEVSDFEDTTRGENGFGSTSLK